MTRLGLRLLAVGYLGALLAAPVALVAYRALEGGIGPALDALTSDTAIHAFGLTLTIALVAVPANTVFGILFGLAVVRGRFPGRGFLNAVVDLPLALSPVVVGLALLLLFGRDGWLGGFGILFSPPAMILATVFVSLPFVAREVVPVLREIGTEQEQAAATLGASAWTAFARVTLPAIRWAVAYGAVLTAARSLGEYGAVAVVSGRIAGRTETATLLVDERFQNFDLVGAYAASLVLAAVAVVVLLTLTAIDEDAV
jgi:sulfate transport system permease protein